MNPAFPAHALALRALTEAGNKLGVELHRAEARTPDEFEKAFETFLQVRVGAVVVLTSTIVIKERERLAELSRRYRLPVMFGAKEPVHAGGLMSYGANVDEMVRRFAVYVDRVLRGKRPADLPVEQAATFELVVNLKTAKTLGLTIPPAVLVRANEIIQ